MDHQVVTLVAVGAIIGIREANINRFIETAVRLELVALDAVEPFRAFKIALALFRAKPTGIIADAETVQQLILLAHLHVKLKGALFFKDLNINRRAHKLLFIFFAKR